MMYLRTVLCFIVLLFPLKSFSQLKSIDYLDVESFRVQKADMQEVTVVLNLRFYNPNRYGLTLKDGDIDAYFNNKYLGKALVDEKTKVPARDTFLIPVTLTASLGRVFGNALDVLTNRTVLIKLEGTIKAGKAGIFIRVPVKYEGEQQLDF